MIVGTVFRINTLPNSDKSVNATKAIQELKATINILQQKRTSNYGYLYM